MKFEQTKASRSHRPRLTADVLQVRPTEEGALDIRREVQGSLRNAWEEYVVGLYEESEKSSDKASDLYQATALLRMLTKNVGAEWTPPNEWKPVFATRSTQCMRKMDKARRDRVSFGPNGLSLHNYYDMQLQGIVQTFPELRTAAQLSTDTITHIGKIIISDISDGDLTEGNPVIGVEHEYALVVLRPDQGKFVVRKNAEHGLTPETFYTAVTKMFPRRADGAHILASLRLLYPRKQQDVLQLWTPEYQKEVEEQFAAHPAQSLKSMQYAFALMVMQAEDAQLVDGEVVLQLPQPTLKTTEPIPQRPHV